LSHFVSSINTNISRIFVITSWVHSDMYRQRKILCQINSQGRCTIRSKYWFSKWMECHKWGSSVVFFPRPKWKLWWHSNWWSCIFWHENRYLWIFCHTGLLMLVPASSSSYQILWAMSGLTSIGSLARTLISCYCLVVNFNWTFDLKFTSICLCYRENGGVLQGKT
jgi:hypothetical protein